MVEYDSIIPPGREGTMTQKVSLSGRSGKVTKSVTLVSNAENEQNVRVSLSVNILPLIGTSVHYIRLSENSEENTPITLRSQKKDLAVTEVNFESRKSGVSGANWQADLPLSIPFQLTREKGPDEEGYYSFVLTLQTPENSQESGHGNFSIRTNHLDKKELRFGGRIR